MEISFPKTSLDLQYAFSAGPNGLQGHTRGTGLLYKAIQSRSKPSKALHRKAPETSSGDKLREKFDYNPLASTLIVVLVAKKVFSLFYNNIG